jgi:hypothetical protein
MLASNGDAGDRDRAVSLIRTRRPSSGSGRRSSSPADSIRCAIRTTVGTSTCIRRASSPRGQRLLLGQFREEEVLPGVDAQGAHLVYGGGLEGSRGRHQLASEPLTLI